MTAKTYEAISAPFRGHPKRLAVLKLLSKGLPLPVYAAYPLLLCGLLAAHDPRFLRAFLVPAISFVLLTVFRDRLNAPRPYEALDISPLITKNTKGHSFPSRHVFSASVIACTFFYVLPPIGTVLLVISVLLAVIRVIGGIHFPRDVLAGMVCGLLSGWIGFVLL